MTLRVASSRNFSFFGSSMPCTAMRHRLGVKLIGDLPIFVSGESADVWSHPHLFQLDRDRRPKFVAGVPPDYFSATGQHWGNPLYDWHAMEKEGFALVDRAGTDPGYAQADLVPHRSFRGFAACWTIPRPAKPAQQQNWGWARALI